VTRPPRALSTLIACIYDCAGGQDDWAPVLAELAAYAGYYHERDVLFANGHAAMRAGRGAGITRRGHIDPYPMPLVGGVRPCAPDPCGSPGPAKGA
jgi:hypothetical protein